MAWCIFGPLQKGEFGLTFWVLPCMGHASAACSCGLLFVVFFPHLLLHVHTSRSVTPFLYTPSTED